DPRHTDIAVDVPGFGSNPASECTGRVCPSEIAPDPATLHPGAHEATHKKGRRSLEERSGCVILGHEQREHPYATPRPGQAVRREIGQLPETFPRAARADKSLAVGPAPEADDLDSGVHLSFQQTAPYGENEGDLVAAIR